MRLPGGVLTVNEGVGKAARRQEGRSGPWKQRCEVYFVLNVEPLIMMIVVGVSKSRLRQLELEL